MNRKLKSVISFVITVSFILCSGVQSFAADVNAVSIADDPSSISMFAVDNEVNIIVEDANGNIVNEYHTDGLAINYTIDAERNMITEVANSDGVRMTIDTVGRERVFKTYDENNELVNTESIQLAATKSILNVDTTNIKKAAEQTEEVDEMLRNGEITQEEVNNLTVAASDTFYNGYNISTMIPSVWTENMGYDKFARPSTAMTEAAIQTLFVNKSSVLRNNIQVWAYDSNGILYNTGRVVKPSKVVFDTSKKYAINPKVILAKLQGEQGLVTKTSGAVNTRAFAFCMGNGATDGGDYYSQTGFDRQVDSGTRVLLNHWNTAYNMGQGGFPHLFAGALDGSLYVNNCGTYAFFKYTPWQSSNALLCDVFSSLFPGSGHNYTNWN